MAKKTKTDGGATPPGPPRLKAPSAAFAKELAARIEVGQELIKREIPSRDDIRKLRDDYYNWHDFNRDLLRQRFTTDEIAEEYAHFAGAVIAMDPTPEQELHELRSDISDYVRRLVSIQKRLPLFEEIQASTNVRPIVSPAATTSGVFIVHGRDDRRKVEVARFLEGLGVEVVILHEQANQGRTLIEKFEEHAGQAGYAVVLLTPDDEGGLRGGTARQGRARQNVVFELGFFYGKLGRNRVCVLYDPGVELPSDVSGIAYLRLDADWKLALGRELKAAQIAFDPANLLR